MIEESLNSIKRNYMNKKVCVLGTKGTIETRVYHNNEQAKGIDFVYANDLELDVIMSVITDTKADKDKVELTNRLLSAVRGIKEREEDCVFLIACTELSLYKKAISEYALVIDAMDCLVESTISKCGYKLK
jgi:aspartate racemase